MSRLTRSQKKGKISSYTSRFLKKQVSYASYCKNDTLEVMDFLKSKKANGVVMKVKGKCVYHLPAPLKVFKGQILKCTHNESQDYGPIKNWPIGTLVCNVQKPSSKTHYFSSAGCSAKIQEITKDYVSLITKSRVLKFHPESYALKGVVSNGGLNLKPYGKAGTKAKIFRAKGKKYPEVSASAMNAQEHALGGSYKKRRGRPMTTSRSAPPKAKFGSIAAKRTGKK